MFQKHRTFSSTAAAGTRIMPCMAWNCCVTSFIPFPPHSTSLLLLPLAWHEKLCVFRRHILIWIKLAHPLPCIADKPSWASLVDVAAYRAGCRARHARLPFACRSPCCRENNSMLSEAAEKLCDPIPCVEHASLHRAWWNSNDRRDLVD